MTMGVREDTQWPRYQVFLQEREGAPYGDVGSVHAVDAEMALQNARDVFARRPECHSLWVVPVAGIFSKTRQELERWGEAQEPETTEKETYYFSYKLKAAGTHTVMGTVEAASPAEAMRLAVRGFKSPQPPFSWWVFPARLVTQTDPDEAASLFGPGLDKTFRLSGEFKTVTVMRGLKQSDQ